MTTALPGTFAYKRDRVTRVALFALLSILPLISVFGHRGMAPWLLLAAMPAFVRGDFWQTAIGLCFDRPSLANPLFAAFISVLGLSAWVALSAIWGPTHDLGYALYFLGPVLVGGTVIWFGGAQVPIWTHRYSFAYLFAVIGALLLLLLEGVTNGALRAAIPPHTDAARDSVSLSRGVTIFVPAIFPAAAIAFGLWRSRLPVVAILALGFLTCVMHEVTANALAFLSGLVAAGLTFLRPKLMVKACFGVLLLALLLAPLWLLVPADIASSTLAQSLPASWVHRLVIWQSVAQEAVQGFPFGFGADYARELTKTAGMVNIPGVDYPLPRVSIHPHNVFLQIWLEFGLPGVVLTMLSLWFGFRAFAPFALIDVPRSVVAALAGMTIAITVSFMVEASLWQLWRLAAIAFAGMGISYAVALERLRRKA